MIDNNQGKVVPFRLTATRMRRRAEEHARRGRTLEAIELYRRAAQEDELPTGWLYLARLLRSCSCYEQAMRVLYRMISRGNVPSDAWLELAKCQQALDMHEGMRDSLYHLLDEDPYSETADEGRDMLAEMDVQNAGREPFRLPLISRRAMNAWSKGEKHKALRRFRRMAKMATHPGQVYATMAMLCLPSSRPKLALIYAARALRLEPKSIRVRTMAAFCFAMQGRKRFAQALLESCIADVGCVSEENMLLSTLETVGMRSLKQKCISARLRLMPYRAELLRVQAEECVRKNDLAGAERLWNTILRIDPVDVGAQMMLRTLQYEPEAFETDTVKQRARIRLETKLAETIIRQPQREAFLPGNETRTALDWCVTQEKHILRRHAVEAAIAAEATEYVAELLTCPGVHPEARREIMDAMAEKGKLTQRPVLMGQCIALAQAAQRHKDPYAMEKRFLMLVMLETKRHHMTRVMVELAAEAWHCMTPRMRREAIGKSSYAYVKAIEIIRLRMAGKEDAARRVVEQLNVSFRRVERAINKLVLVGAVEVSEGDTDDEMYQF